VIFPASWYILLMRIVEYSQKPHYTRTLPGIVYDSWKITQFKSSDIKSLEAEFRKNAIKQTLDSYKTPELERAISLGNQEAKELVQKLLDLINQNEEASYENYWQLIKNDYWDEITKELYDDIMQHERYENITIYMPAQQGALYAGFVIRQTIKYISNFKTQIKIISKGIDLMQKISEDNTDKNLIILVGFSPKFLNLTPYAKIYVIDQTHTDPNVVAYPNFRVISAYPDLLKYYKNYIPIGLLAHRVVYNIWRYKNQQIPGELKVICGFSVLSDGVPRDIESNIIVDNAIQVMRSYYDNFGSGNIYSPLRWLIDLGLALRVNIGSITAEKIIYKILPVLAMPIRLSSEWYNLSLAILVNMDNPDIKRIVATDLIDAFVAYASSNSTRLKSIVMETRKDPETGQDITTIDPEISYYISLIEGDIYYRAKNLSKQHLQNHYTAIIPTIRSMIQNPSPKVFLFNTSTAIPTHANKKRDRNVSASTPIDSTNISFARVVYAILKLLYTIRREYAKYVKSKYVPNSYINYDAKILREYLTNPSDSNKALLTDSRIGVYIINQEVIKMDVSTSVAADLSRITFKPVILIADNGNTYEVVISDIAHGLVQKVLEPMIHVAPALQKLPILNVVLSHNQVRITTPKTSIDGIHTLINQLDKAIKGAVLDIEHPYQRIIPSNKRIAYAPIKDEKQLDGIKTTLKDLAQLQNEDNSFFFNIDKSIVRFSIYKDDSTGKVMTNCKIFAPKKLSAVYFMEIIQNHAKAVLNSSLISNFDSKLVIEAVLKNSSKTLSKLSSDAVHEKEAGDFEFLINELGAVNSLSAFLEKIGGRGDKANPALNNYFWTISGELSDTLATALIHSPEYDKIQKRFKTLYPNGIDENGDKVSIYPIITVARVIVNLYSENTQNSLKTIIRDIINTGSFMNIRPIVSKQNLPIIFIASI
jgi:hypothetical protein